MRELENRTAIITGASQGLGLEIARRFVSNGASVVMCARGPDQLEQARSEIQALARANQKVIARTGDVSKPGDVQEIVGLALRQFEQIHILVNNAGIYGPLGLIEDVIWDDWVRALEINLLGSVMMCREILPHFKKNAYGKIIQLSGGGATSPLPRISAYAASKAAVVRFAETLAEEVKPQKIDVNAIAPGALGTRLLDEVVEAGPETVGQRFHARMTQIKEEGGTPLEVGANLAVFLASAASDGISGKLISAVWDPWEALPGHLQELTESDVYTLRRIIPSDRGMDWGER